MLLRAHRQGGRWIGLSALCFVGTAWINWYLALVAAAGAGVAALLARSASLWKAVGLSALALLPLVAYQLALVSRGSPGDPQTFLELRAAMDHFSLTHWSGIDWSGGPPCLLSGCCCWWPVCGKGTSQGSTGCFCQSPAFFFCFLWDPISEVD